MAQRPATRPVLLPCLLLVVTACLCFSVGGGFVAPSSFRSSASQAVGSKRLSRTALFAQGAAEDDDGEEEDSVEVSGFSGFVIGLAFLPHVCYALVTAFNVATQGQSFDIGPYGLEAVSCTVSVGLVFWSLGSFLGRGRGLPAGPLGLLGLSEGLSYLAALGLAIAAAVTSVRTTGAPSLPPKAGAPAPPPISAPKAPAPAAKQASAPAAKAPEVKVPDVKLPDFKAPEFKAPDFKVPEFKAPEIKAPAFKLPDIKAPDIKLPEVPKLPEAPKPAPAAPKKEEAPAPKPAPTPPPAPKPAPPPPPAPKKEEAKPAPAAKPKEEPKAADYGDLFD